MINKHNYSYDMKYIALYISMNFEEIEENVYIKHFKNTDITIYVDEQKAVFSNKTLSIVGNDCLPLTTCNSFVVLECVDKLLTMGYKPAEMIIDLDNEFDIYVSNLYIKCFEWGTMDDRAIVSTSNRFLSIKYMSRLVSGIIYRYNEIRTATECFNYGIFECDKRQDHYVLYNKRNNVVDGDFYIKEGVVEKYVGKNKRVVVPEGVTEIGSCAFWDNQNIEEVILPTSLEIIGGDAFYNCKNLKRINIPSSVYKMGNNPFAGCPLLTVSNCSKHFKVVDGVVFDKNITTLIYYPINKTQKSFKIPDTVKVIGKHSFFMCQNLYELEIPSSVIRMDNNPFSGCINLSIENRSHYFHIIDGVIYNKFKSAVLGCLNSTRTDKLVLLPIKKINRNSFWNCVGIKSIVLPETLDNIGYNPFAGCSNIRFISNSKYYPVVDGVLYNKDKSKIVCYPAWKAVGHIKLPDHVITLERGAFSGCDKMTEINLHNVNIINKSCFTNCISLDHLYCSDLITYIGEWAFAYCKSLKRIVVGKQTIIDNNAFSNCPCTVYEREKFDNYVIESDNIYTLKSMQARYRNKIDSILIDPPYNSHIDYIGYKDSDYDEGYINFLKERFELAYNLLSPRGFLVINIDEGESNNIYNLCKTIFGDDLVSLHRWKKIHPFFDANRVVLNPNKIQTDYEYIIICRKTLIASYNKIHQPVIKNNILVDEETGVPETFDCFGTTSSAKDEIQAIFGERDYFSTPKPVKLMKELIRATTSKNSIVLDFFAGSGTVGQATIELNKEDDGDRRFILVSNNESNICKEVTYKRVSKITNEFAFLD